MARSKPIIEAQDLVKRFGQVEAVRGVSFDVYAGELFGFLGPNGAGKTTTINLLTGLAWLNAGSIRIAGIDCTHNPKAAQAMIGVVPDESNLYPELTGYENLCFCASLYGLSARERQKRARKLLEDFDLTGAGGRKFSTYSKGMKRKLTIAAGIIHKPSILFLDEPTTGIDVASARRIRQLIARLHREGTTIFLTTHYIEEAERLCDRIAFIVNGHIVHTDNVTNLIRSVPDTEVIMFSLSGWKPRLFEKLTNTFPTIMFYMADDSRIRLESAEHVRIAPVIQILEECGVEVTDARRLQPSLEDIFVRITGIEASSMRKEKEKGGAGR